EGVKIFDRNKVTCLATDWSKDGIGFWLVQKHCECDTDKPFCCPEGWKIVLVGSRFTHSAEARYAPIEGEALAVADALDKARYFVLGSEKLILAGDHKPLLRILGNRSLEDIPNSQVRNLKEKTLRYRFTVVHIPGLKHKAADSVSRHPTGPAEKLILTDDIAILQDDSQDNFLATIRLPKPVYCALEQDLITASISTLDTVKSVTWDRVRIETSSDENMNKLLGMIEHGLLENRREYPPPLQEYFQFAKHLSSLDGVILYKDRIVIPPSLRGEVLDSLRAAYQGVTAMTARAESSITLGTMATNAFQRAILQYRNSPDRDTRLSPAMCLFSHPIKDFIPIPPGKYKPHNTWRETLDAREEALRVRHMRESEKWSEHTKRLPPLIIGDHVRVQNQTGQYPLKWDKTGTIIEVRQFDQYVVKMDGSGRVSL
ncbi:hypothetical protein ScPMuIL_005663, partial [Solemya velum]